MKASTRPTASERTLTLDELNLLTRAEAAIVFSRCCGSSQWAKAMALRRPFYDENELFKFADTAWRRLSPDDWKEAFSHHPRIGDVHAVREKFAATASWAEREQAGTAAASEQTLKELADGNVEYERRFGYIFIVCATGKSADEMLGILKERLTHPPADEIHVAAEEQRKITRLRLEKLLGNVQR